MWFQVKCQTLNRGKTLGLPLFAGDVPMIQYWVLLVINVKFQGSRQTISNISSETESLQSRGTFEIIFLLDCYLIIDMGTGKGPQRLKFSGFPQQHICSIQNRIVDTLVRSEMPLIHFRAYQVW